MVSLSSSAYNTAATCLKRFEYAYVDKIVPKPGRIPKAMRRGTWIHRCLEFHDSGLDWRTELISMEQWAVSNGLPGDVADEIKAEVDEIVTGYIAYWSTHSEPMVNVATEYEVKVTVGGHTFSATIDRLVRAPGGIYLMERKSTEHIPGPAWRAVDPQTALQLAICEMSGEFKIAGVIFDYLVTRVPPVPKWKKNGEPFANTLKSVTTSTAWRKGIDAYLIEHDMQPPAGTEELRLRIVNDGAFYQRFRVDRQHHAIKSTLRDVGETITQLERAAQTGHYRRLNNLMFCARFCSYSELCASEYVLGGVAHGLREELFMPDDGVISREGRRKK
jgi:hypothetical protein